MINHPPIAESLNLDDPPIAESLNLDETDSRPWESWDAFGSPTAKKLFDEMPERGREAAVAAKELGDDESAASWFTKESDMATVVWRGKKSMVGIVREIDEYFLKAAAGGKDVAALLESGREQCHPWEFEGRKGKSSKSAKVFNALSWSWSSRSLQSNQDSSLPNSSDNRRSSSHCTTLEKLLEAEKKLYKEVKEAEIAKFEHKKNTLSLQKLESGSHDMLKIASARSSIEELQCRIVSLEESIYSTCMSIAKLRDEELYPQLIELSTGLVKMWRVMYECHQVQNHIAQQINLLESRPGTDPTTDAHQQATAQMEAEVASWHGSFCNLIRSQREYIQILNQWVRLTDCLSDSNGLTGSTSGIHGLCEELQCAFDRLPEKVAAEAIKSFLSVIRSIVLQQTEEQILKKKSDRLMTRLEKELSPLSDAESQNELLVPSNRTETLDPNQNPSSTKNMKLENFKKKAEEERAMYLSSVRTSRAMTVNNLQMSLPNVFQALMGFASMCAQALEGVNRFSQEDVTGRSDGVSPL
ncbi:hypothetical protein ACMD2_08862 [Ananas comosus]|uniref:DUF632 domain-containing protein n=1 Tax=Ananas comosus TaxID=4615 RepID=A0A199VYN8_ANACO|nr:hypothetical protein ACMD2_08862 [Ananas comosus]